MTGRPRLAVQRTAALAVPALLAALVALATVAPERVSAAAPAAPADSAAAVGQAAAVQAAAVDSSAYRPARLGDAARAEPLPPGLEGVGVTEKPESQVPLDAVFRDEDGREVRLGDFFRAGKPVILNLGYYGCPMLCGLVANGLVAGLKDLPWNAGQEFGVVTVSIDPNETPTLARLKKQSYLRELGRPVAAAGWHFLTGREPDIRALTEAVGFGFRWNEERREFAHAAVLIVLTPQGTVSRYLYGIEFDARTLRLSLVEAAEGKVGSPLDRILLYCFHYDASERRYALAAVKLMRAGGLVTALAVTGALALLWRREKRRRREP